ncbi:MAG: TIGR04283 family arsenosugar biosynthesis glycosyltransferase [Thermoplasmatales archaeon]|nr:MAG: TIGR04283 family arsenosugar biosynthesis glycosyltransferase [Thermoplasmatales archaeon]
MISIITPVLNESPNIRPFLEHLNTLSGDFELIFVDGGSTDNTVKEINKYKKKFIKNLTLLKSFKGRGKQMNKGASVAKGKIILFLHVDCTIQNDAILIIEKEMKNNKIIGGGMIQAFTFNDRFLKLVSNFGNLRSKMSQIFFGDTGIFISRDVFKKIGGYDELIFLEDVEFCRKAKKYGKLKQIDSIIYTSSRRYLKVGKTKITIIFTITYFLNKFGFRPKYLTKFIVDK